MSDDLEEKLAELRRRFIADAQVSCAALLGALEGQDMATMRRIAHRLAGRGGMFGFPQITAAAQDLEAAIDLGGAEAKVTEHCRSLIGLLAS